MIAMLYVRTTYVCLLVVMTKRSHSRYILRTYYKRRWTRHKTNEEASAPTYVTNYVYVKLQNVFCT